jgi:hypothetical protein
MHPPDHENSPFPPDAPWRSVTLALSGFGGSVSLAPVLQDWFEFLGGRPAEVVYVDGGSGPRTVLALTSLLRRGLIDKLQLLNPASWENDFHRCYIQEYHSGALATSPYIVFVKPDTLPFRRGHDRWLAEDLRALDRTAADGRPVLAVTLPHLIDPPLASDGPYLVHDFASLNFTLMKRSTFRDAMRSQIGEFIDSDFRGEFPAHIDCDPTYRRALVEWAWQAHCRSRGMVTLARRESLDWSIFHVNKIDRKLLALRDRYRAREDVERFFDQPKSLYRPEPRGLSKAGKGVENAVRSIKHLLRGEHSGAAPRADR